MSVKFKVKPIEEARLTLCEWLNHDCASVMKVGCTSCPIHRDHQYTEYTHKEAKVIIVKINKEIR